ncbi:hypothetical protein CWM22_08795 [Streptococcus suis]|nr:hypothetical protein CWM22_08795 [Streptococcus suis]
MKQFGELFQPDPRYKKARKKMLEIGRTAFASKAVGSLYSLADCTRLEMRLAKASHLRKVRQSELTK